MKIDLIGQKTRPVTVFADHDAGGTRKREIAEHLEWELAMLASRRIAFPPAKFSDGQWHMMVHLYVARHLDGQHELMTKDVLQVTGLAQGTAWRHLKDLEEKGAVTSHRLDEDARRVVVSLTPEYCRRVEEVMARILLR